MKRITAIVLAGSLATASLAGAGSALAAHHPRHSHVVRHRTVVRHKTVVHRRVVVTHRVGATRIRPTYHWRTGGRIPARDWGRGRRIDYRVYHLRAPPRGYEWREVDGNYVLAAITGGLIASVLLANH